MDEARLDYLGQEPLQKFVNTIRKLYRGKTTQAYIMNPRQGLSNALGFLHSRGVDALFDFSIEGDSGADPNNMISWFSQPSLELPSKEYYKDKNIIIVYQDVIERILSSLRDDQVLSQENPGIILQMGELEDSEHVWPPWPWPPWDEEGDDDDNEDGRERSPGDHFQNARELAHKVVKFETEIADATLDLPVLFEIEQVLDSILSDSEHDHSDVTPPAVLQHHQANHDDIVQEARSKTPGSSCLDADATRFSRDGDIEEGQEDFNTHFFRPSELPSHPPHSHSFFFHRIRLAIPRHHRDLPVEQKPFKLHNWFRRRARSSVPSDPTTSKLTESTSAATMEHPEVVEVHAVRGFQKTDQSNGSGGRCISILVTGWRHTIAYGAWTFST
ncbi:hypothetical protein CY34DRAFT_782039 [Suillus luteus UH-Slu-Lm8-n1]|uniref:Peptidase M13 N-terminal domain-containing protein n=1 Tax=Suillus luteus UH-Slu-Lm8-n1 TaxID=930992 RepID=A0A0D0BG48_9AGAM|nr:hypothetical protein CY34DRAFT_782039 [Suillus luteus UH-Slu-Lm8-n1]